MRLLNLEAGYPTVQEARQHLIAEIRAAQRDKIKVLKLIHGYGSSGQGGALRPAIRKSLSLRRKEGAVRLFIPGERWDIFSPETRQALDQHPELARDADLKRCNPGVTIVVIR